MGLLPGNGEEDDQRRNGLKISHLAWLDLSLESVYYL